MTIALFQAQGWEREYIQKKLHEAGIACDFYDEPLSFETLPEKRDYDALSVFVGSSVTKEVIDAFPHLKLITTRSTGFDHIDCSYARSKNIALGYVPFYGEHTVAEFTMGLILTLSRKLYWGIDRIKRDNSFSYDGLTGFDLKGKTLGVIGAGRIGRHVIRMARGFDMNVIAYDRSPQPSFEKELEFSYASIDDVLTQADIITLHVFYSPETHHLINMENIHKIKRGAYLINTARGPVVDTKALVLALEKGILAGVGLDVLEEEGIMKDEMGYWWKESPGNEYGALETILLNSVLANMPNVVITPHNAFNTHEAIGRILDADVENIKAFLEKSAVAYPIL